MTNHFLNKEYLPFDKVLNHSSPMLSFPPSVYSPNGMKFRSKPEILRNLGENIDISKFDFTIRKRSEDSYCSFKARKSPPKDLDIDIRKVKSPPNTKIQNRTNTKSPSRRSPRISPPEEKKNSPLRLLSPSLKKASMMKPLRQTCGVMRLPIEYVRPDHTNTDDAMPEKLLQNGLLQDHWDTRLKSFYPVDGKTGEVMTPPPPTNPIQSNIIIQTNPIQTNHVQPHGLHKQVATLPNAQYLNKMSSPPGQNPSIIQPTKILQPQQVQHTGNPVSLNLAPGMLSNTNHNLSPATVNQLHALLLKNPPKSEATLPQTQPSYTTLQQPRLAKPIPSKPIQTIQNKPANNPVYILQGGIPGDLQLATRGPAPQAGAGNLIQIVSNQPQGQTTANKVMQINNASGLKRQEQVLLLNVPQSNSNNSQPQSIKMNKQNAMPAPIPSRQIVQPVKPTPQQIIVSEDVIRKQELRIEQLKKQLLAAESTKTS